MTILELDTLLQERVDHLLQLKEQRMDTLRLLQEKDEVSCYIGQMNPSFTVFISGTY